MKEFMRSLMSPKLPQMPDNAPTESLMHPSAPKKHTWTYHNPRRGRTKRKPK
jgi:hypothetical protein